MLSYERYLIPSLTKKLLPSFLHVYFTPESLSRSTVIEFQTPSYPSVAQGVVILILES